MGLLASLASQGFPAIRATASQVTRVCKGPLSIRVIAVFQVILARKVRQVRQAQPLTVAATYCQDFLAVQLTQALLDLRVTPALPRHPHLRQHHLSGGGS